MYENLKTLKQQIKSINLLRVSIYLLSFIGATYVASLEGLTAAETIMIGLSYAIVSVVAYQTIKLITNLKSRCETEITSIEDTAESICQELDTFIPEGDTKKSL